MNETVPKKNVYIAAIVGLCLMLAISVFWLLAAYSKPTSNVQQMRDDWQVLVVPPNCNSALRVTTFGTHLKDALESVRVEDAAYSGAGCKK